MSGVFPAGDHRDKNPSSMETKILRLAPRRPSPSVGGSGLTSETVAYPYHWLWSPGLMSSLQLCNLHYDCLWLDRQHSSWYVDFKSQSGFLDAIASLLSTQDFPMLPFWTIHQFSEFSTHYRRTDGLMDWWTDGLMDWWTDGLMDWWTDGQVDGWTDGLMDWCCVCFIPTPNQNSQQR